MTTIELGKTYQSESNSFREAWNNGRVAAEQAHGSVNSMVRILKRDNKDWAIRKILSKIAADHTDLDGFSIQNLYKYLDEENSKMLQTNSVSHGTTKGQKNDTPPTPTPPNEPTPKYYEDTIKLQQQTIQAKDDALKEKDTKIQELEEAFHQTNQFIEATKIPNTTDAKINLTDPQNLIENAVLNEENVFDWLAKRHDGIHSFWFDAYGRELFQNRIISQLKNSGVKTFKRLYFEV